MSNFSDRTEVIWISDTDQSLCGDKYSTPRPLAEVEADIQTLEQEILVLLGKVTSG